MFVRTESFKDFIRFYPVITIIIAIHIILYLITVLPFFPGSFIFEKLMGVNLYIAQGEYWRLVTPIFLHSGFPHMLFNSFSLVLFGPSLERLLGKTRFIALYIATGIIANLATLLLKPMTYTHVGSSGAIFGLFGIYIAMILFRRDLMSRANTQLILTIAVISLIMTFLQPNINITAHLFGFISGIILGSVGIGRGRELAHTVKSISNRTRERTSFTPKSLILIGIIILALIGLLSR
ncbi:rhomboid family intramembrane serine protease [Bacillus dakarensis]|uniref:rhomboid family intramembrane serine protease n=1 Tax=Robertmurraya dakarensis TaxID=1926278 RepID=UPI000981423B|nr:rhomboid family intramembrane serine protease [Bacillus dakarensis]